MILDALQAGNATSQADALRKAGVTVKLMRGIKGNGIMHHKVAIYDGAVVHTGSFNWTDNASCCSWENSVFLADPNVVRRYQEEFYRQPDVFDAMISGNCNAMIPQHPCTEYRHDEMSVTHSNPPLAR